MTLTRAEFEHACQAYLSKYHSPCSASNTVHDGELLKRYPTGWSWHEHSLVPGLGYLSRLVSISSRPADAHDSLSAENVVHEAEDEATASVSGGLLACRQYVVFSPSFQVPALYFSMHHSSGAPLSLEEIIKSTMFIQLVLPSTPRTTFALETPDSPFAMLSQGEHPTLSIPCWYLHPCRTAEVVDEILKEVGCEDADRPLRWLEAWFMVLGNVVDFRAE